MMYDLNKLKKIFLDSCNKAIKKHNSYGEMPSGHNGSYHDPETPIRNTAHWILSFAKAYQLTNDKRFYNAITLSLNCLKNEKWRPNDITFLCRNKQSKDKCNGLIGQAWVIEGLIKGYEVTGDVEALELAIKVFKKHPFDKKRGIWKRVEPNGDVLGFDFTFNHQLWFALAGFLIVNQRKDNSIEEECNNFFNGISDNLKISNKGRIGQSMKIDFVNDVVKILAKKIIKRDQIRYMKLKEIGYHSFNTHAFSKIQSIFPNLDFFKTKTYKKIINYLNSNEYNKGILKSDYGFPYNPPGFETFYTYNINYLELKKSKNKILKLLENQIENHYDEVYSSFSKNVHDKNTSFARIYELAESL